MGVDESGQEDDIAKVVRVDRDGSPADRDDRVARNLDPPIPDWRAVDGEHPAGPQHHGRLS
jgi:hypothetical protein